MKDQRKNVHNMIPIDIYVYAKPNNSCFQSDSHAMLGKKVRAEGDRIGLESGYSMMNRYYE